MITLVYKDQTLEDGKPIDLGMVRKELKSAIIEAKNTTPDTIENIKIKSNMPDEAYRFVAPKAIPPGQMGRIQVIIDPDKLWASGLRQVALLVAYDEVRDLLLGTP